MSELMRSLWSEEDGATAVEYSLMAILIAAVVVAAVTLLGMQVNAGLLPVIGWGGS